MSIIDEQTCPAVGYQSVGICVPVTVTPFVNAGPTITKCCNEPVVTAGDKTCGGRKNGSCVFTISQQICVEVPVEFGAVATTGDAYVDCLGASSRNICEDCEEA